MPKIVGRPESDTLKRAPFYCAQGHRTLDWTPGCSVCLREGIARVIADHGEGFKVEIHSVPS